MSPAVLALIALAEECDGLADAVDDRQRIITDVDRRVVDRIERKLDLFRRADLAERVMGPAA